MFKVGDEVLCVDDNRHNTITAGRLYKILDLTGVTQSPVVIDDTGKSCAFFTHRFIPNTPEAKAEYMKNKIMEE